MNKQQILAAVGLTITMFLAGWFTAALYDMSRSAKKQPKLVFDYSETGPLGLRLDIYKCVDCQQQDQKGYCILFTGPKASF